MLSKVLSYSLTGLDGFAVDIEIDINSGIPSCEIVGLPDTAVKESKERVRAAIKNSGYSYPLKRIIINLAPANRRKEGPVFDLAIAVGIMSASGQLNNENYKNYCLLGELSLDGTIRPISGILPILISGLQNNVTKFLIPKENEKEASYIKGIEVYAVENLKDVIEFLNNNKHLEKCEFNSYNNESIENLDYCVDFSEVKGQQAPKRALEIAVAGGHNVMMIGPPGSGKTMLAKCIPSIMPSMTFDEAIEVTKIHSISGMLDKNVGIVNTRPFRSPHHTATIPSLVGGGSNSHPGEISLAHNGVLFLDEMPEYNRKTLETLRQPLEDHRITIARASQTVEYPARFMMIASMNPCPCGHYGSKKGDCQCSSAQIKAYVSKLSGPLMDRIDLHIEADDVSFEQLRSKSKGESSAEIRKRVERVRALQIERFKNYNIFTNSQMSTALIEKFCKIDKSSEQLLKMAFDKLSLSARATTRILKVARTIADIENCENINSSHIAEAIQYRSLDRKYWL